MTTYDDGKYVVFSSFPVALWWKTENLKMRNFLSKTDKGFSMLLETWVSHSIQVPLVGSTHNKWLLVLTSNISKLTWARFMWRMCAGTEGNGEMCDAQRVAISRGEPPQVLCMCIWTVPPLDTHCVWCICQRRAQRVMEILIEISFDIQLKIFFCFLVLRACDSWSSFRST